MGNAKIIPAGLGLPLVLVLLAAVVGGMGQGWAEGGSTVWDFSRLGELIAAALEAGFVEEILFRGVLLWSCLSWARSFSQREASCALFRNPARFAMVASSLVFGLFHLLPDGPLLQSGANIGIAAVQALLKVAQSTLFGLVMAMLVLRSPFDRLPQPCRSFALAMPIAFHSLFDLLYWGPLLLSGGTLPSTYLTGDAAELIPLVAVTALLGLAALLAGRRFVPSSKVLSNFSSKKGDCLHF